jgi:hypothetical protein
MAFFFIVGIITLTATQSGVVDVHNLDKPPVLENYVKNGKAEYNFNR